MTTPSATTEKEPQKRFIAGAVCPACQVMDGIRMWEVDEVPHRDCVHCGYSDTLNAEGNSIPNELPTRVNVSALQKPKESKGQALQFFPNPKLKK
ncbi:YheV family putative zinc ribbon protein [Denitrificimonas caeni]|uniref:YheV family putative metal-binding protein n=1 Tax=Denitrificimonas caeni TaxID=521720 RepID=A0AAE9VPN0_9GAMM|nr:YheV family putative zinc ribbon protein [Denitrificimonas caeni]NLJ11758.1 YheV family putative metal-binding protein [Gammaproteobacteria bacterium]WBE25823.1 YheV family putative metal-binding protein [Denitrificimonas caeni]